jgi:hypothetical protein
VIWLAYLYLYGWREWLIIDVHEDSIAKRVFALGGLTVFL